MRDPPVTVRASYFALLDFRDHYFQAGSVSPNHMRHVSELDASHVIELQDDGVRLTAVDARMFCQVSVQPGPLLLSIPFRVLPGASRVPRLELRIFCVPLGHVGLVIRGPGDRIFERHGTHSSSSRAMSPMPSGQSPLSMSATQSSSRSFSLSKPTITSSAVRSGPESLRRGCPLQGTFGGLRCGLSAVSDITRSGSGRQPSSSKIFSAISQAFLVSWTYPTMVITSEPTLCIASRAISEARPMEMRPWPCS